MSDKTPGAPGEDNVDWNMMARSDPAIEEMAQAGVPMTRENYLDAQFDGNVPEEWNEESEMGLPPQLQGFQGVGLSELPAGPLPLPMGQIGQGTRPQLEAEPMPAGDVQPPAQPAASVPERAPPAAETPRPVPTDEGPMPRFTSKPGYTAPTNQPKQQQG